MYINKLIYLQNKAN